jgi:hypothetical protein
VSEEEREYLNETIRNLNNQLVDALRERDEARQSYCSLMEAYRGGDGKATAEKMGWQYLFKEDGK